jgi:dTDP-4-amino-4,6-dideoxygalactose transaminase
MRPAPFEQPIYVTRPLSPPLAEYVKRLEAIWESGWFANSGPQHVELERVLAGYLQAPHLSLFNNGTIAMIVACQALRLAGEVITTPFTFPATPHVLSWNGITPVFADVDPATMNLDPGNIEPLITNRTSAILAVHVYGTPCDVDAIQRVADSHGLKVVYDGAHAFGMEIDGRPITGFGDATMLSFHATKLFHTAEGGALVVQDENVKARINLLKNFGIKNEFEVLMPGINGKMSELQAALGLEVLRCLDGERAARARVAAIYRLRLGALAGVTLAAEPPGVRPSYQYFVVRIGALARRTRDEVFSGLREFNIHARKYFYPLCSEYSCYRMLPSASPALLPVAHRVAGEVLCLPFYGALADADAERICDVFEHLLAG